MNSDMNRSRRVAIPLITNFIFLLTVVIAASPAHAFQFRWLTHPQVAIDYWPRFSPDGKTVLFTRQTAQTSVFATVPARGGAITPFLDMTGEGYNITRADWNWNTNQVALTAIDTTVSPQILSTWIVNGDGTDPVQVPSLRRSRSRLLMARG
jgi:hypothetical protein